jgi:hypothetical protein
MSINLKRNLYDNPIRKYLISLPPLKSNPAFKSEFVCVPGALEI